MGSAVTELTTLCRRNSIGYFGTVSFEQF